MLFFYNFNYWFFFSYNPRLIILTVQKGAHISNLLKTKDWRKFWNNAHSYFRNLFERLLQKFPHFLFFYFFLFPFLWICLTILGRPFLLFSRVMLFSSYSKQRAKGSLGIMHKAISEFFFQVASTEMFSCFFHCFFFQTK